MGTDEGVGVAVGSGVVVSSGAGVGVTFGARVGVTSGTGVFAPGTGVGSEMVGSFLSNTFTSIVCSVPSNPALIPTYAVPFVSDKQLVLCTGNELN